MMTSEFDWAALGASAQLAISQTAWPMLGVAGRTIVAVGLSVSAFEILGQKPVRERPHEAASPTLCSSAPRTRSIPPENSPTLATVPGAAAPPATSPDLGACSRRNTSRSGSRLLSHAAEERAQKLVAVQFFLLAPYVAFEALHKLAAGEQAETSWLGIALVTSSLVGMPLLGIAKRRLANTLGSVATRGEGTQNLLCAYLAAAVLVGLLGNALFRLWWLDPAAALVVARVAVREGRQSWRGEGCCDAC
jgi:Cation efflux family